MTSLSNRNFDALIAYLIPGFTTLLRASFFSQTILAWLTGATADGPTVGLFAGDVPSRLPSETLFLCHKLKSNLRCFAHA